MLSGTTVIIVIQLYWIMFNTKPQRVVIGAIKGTSSARLHDELAWEPLSIRRERHKLRQFYKIVQNLTRRYLTELLLKISSECTHFRLRSRENFPQLRCRTSTFQKSFFPSCSNHLLEFSGLRCPKLCISSHF